MRCGRATCWRRARIASAPPLERIVVAVDPPASSGKRADRCGIVAAGIAQDMLVQCSRMRRSTRRGRRNGRAPLSRSITGSTADALIAEVNQGGEMVRAVIHEADPSVPVKEARATRGKYLRAAPVAQLYEQGRVRHVGAFPALEDEMCDFGARRFVVGPQPRPTRRAGVGDHHAGADAARRASRACGDCERGERSSSSATSLRASPLTDSRRFHQRTFSCPPFSPASSARARRSRRPRAPPLSLAFIRSAAPQWTARNNVALTRAGYERNAVCYRAVRMMAEGCASVPWLAL